MSGWNTDEIPNLMSALEDCMQVHYELQNCIRGCYTGVRTYPELKKHIGILIRRLEAGAEDCDFVQDEGYEE